MWQITSQLFGRYFVLFAKKKVAAGHFFPHAYEKPYKGSFLFTLYFFWMETPETGGSKFKPLLLQYQPTLFNWTVKCWLPQLNQLFSHPALSFLRQCNQVGSLTLLSYFQILLFFLPKMIHNQRPLVSLYLSSPNAAERLSCQKKLNHPNFLSFIFNWIKLCNLWALKYKLKYLIGSEMPLTLSPLPSLR